MWGARANPVHILMNESEEQKASPNRGGASKRQKGCFFRILQTV